MRKRLSSASHSNILALSWTCAASGIVLESLLFLFLPYMSIPSTCGQWPYKSTVVYGLWKIFCGVSHPKNLDTPQTHTHFVFVSGLGRCILRSRGEPKRASSPPDPLPGAQLVVELFLFLPRVIVGSVPTNQPTHTHTQRKRTIKKPKRLVKKSGQKLFVK